jgi:hypothetical protein
LLRRRNDYAARRAGDGVATYLRPASSATASEGARFDRSHSLTRRSNEVSLPMSMYLVLALCWSVEPSAMTMAIGGCGTMVSDSEMHTLDITSDVASARN